ncbi:MAG: hypothetical protein MUD01_26305 [Chloroflexaceae bacterium]|jgi:hypothetical protein|nr:hypothetical protein [Chloroflexaceae bacterium]
MTNDQSPTPNPQTPAESEQIGPLLFVPNADYPYPFDVPVPPRFWMEEQTGALADAVETYMNGERLKPEQLNLIKIYLRQYLERAVMTGDANRNKNLGRVEKLRTTSDIEQFAEELAEWGVEAF